jgi:hypothetical protein
MVFSGLTPAFTAYSNLEEPNPQFTVLAGRRRALPPFEILF